MDIRSKIASGHSKAIAIQVSEYVQDKPDRFKELINLFFSDSYRSVQRAAWSVNLCVEKHPELIKPYWSRIVPMLASPDAQVAVKRNVLRMIQFVSVPVRYRPQMIDICFGILSRKNETVAVKVFAMSVLAELVGAYPELVTELKILLEDQMPYETAGYRSRASKVLKTFRARSAAARK